MDAAEFDEVNAPLDRANRGCGRKPVNGANALRGVPRKRTRFPGQHARCWYCGRQVVWGGNGVTGNLMRSGAREWRCWNSIGFSGDLAGRKVAAAIVAELYRLEEFDPQWREMVGAAGRAGSDSLAERRRRLQGDEQSLAREQVNVTAAIAECGPRPMLKQKLAELEDRGRELAWERQRIEALANRRLELPLSVGQLRGSLEEKFAALAAASAEFGELMRQLVPEFHVYLVRLCDGGHPLPRAKVRLALAGAVPDARHVPGLDDIVRRELTIDLFEPPQRERIRKDSVRLSEQGLEQRQIARHGGLPEAATQAAVQRSLALDRTMRALGIETPYVTVSEPPADYSKLRRHQNPKYRFEPVHGYERPAT